MESCAAAGVLRVDVDPVIDQNTHNVDRVVFNSSVQRRSPAVASECEVSAGGAEGLDNFERADTDGCNERRAAFVVWGIDCGTRVDEAPDDQEVGHGRCCHERSGATSVTCVDDGGAHAADRVGWYSGDGLGVAAYLHSTLVHSSWPFWAAS